MNISPVRLSGSDPRWWFERCRRLAALGLLAVLPVLRGAEAAALEVKRATVNGQLEGDRARLVIEADLSGWSAAARPAVFGANFEQHLEVGPGQIRQRVRVQVEALQGELRELVFTLAGTGEVREVTAEGLADWAVRQMPTGRQLVLRLQRDETPRKRFTGTWTCVTQVPDLPAAVQPLTFATEPAVLADGFVRVDAPPELAVETGELTGLVPIEPRYLPEGLRPMDGAHAAPPLAFRFQGALGALLLQVSPADPEARRVTLRDFQLRGDLLGELARFRLSATARVPRAKGGRLELLGGEAALVSFEVPDGVRLGLADGRYGAEFDRAGEFALVLEFDAAVRRTNGWREVSFHLAPAAALPVTLTGLSEDTQLRLAGAARPERRGDAWLSHLPSDGRVRLAWQEGRPEAEGRLFFSAEMLDHVTVSPGVLRQAALFEFRVTQGEMTRVACVLAGGAEITRVVGDAVLAWKVSRPEPEGRRRLEVQLNAPQKDRFTLAVYLQQTLGAFPQTVAATRLEPEGATRFAGFVRVGTQGAVRLDVLEATGLSQISPEQVPVSDTARALLPAPAPTVFAYRFAGPGQRLRLQVEDILPELAVSAVLAYHLGETELGIEAEFEVDVREAPLRELRVRVPAGFNVAAVQAAEMSEYLVTPETDGTGLVRLLYAPPALGRQLVTLRLERNESLREPRWSLPRPEVLDARSTRGQVGISAAAGFRLSPAATSGLTEVATAFFPRPRPGLQAAFRITDPAWAATLAVERLPQTVQVDAFQLFSVGEGVAYGSAVLNYLVSGAPLSALSVELPAGVANVEFTGQHVRSVRKTGEHWRVELTQPVSGAYTLLVTYDRPFQAPGDQLAFTGARPLEVETEQGYTAVVSTHQFRVRPVNVSPALTALEPGEVPPEFRLLFDAPVLAAYRYTARPFNLELALQPLAQGEMLSQVVDRAALTTRISREGQVVTEARYYVKNKGTPHLGLVVPAGTSLWTVLVNSNAVVPVQDDRTHLIRLPQHPDPNTLNEVVVKLAATNAWPHRLTVQTPVLTAPVLLADWQLLPDSDRRLSFLTGTLAPVAGAGAPTGFAVVARLWTGPARAEAWLRVLGMLALTLLALRLTRGLACTPGGRFSARRLGTAAIAALALALVGGLLVGWVQSAEAPDDPATLRFVAPMQPPGSVLQAEVLNVASTAPVWGRLGSFWPVALAGLAWAVAHGTTAPHRARFWRALAWTALAWAALRQPDAGRGFTAVVGLFLLVQVLAPLARAWWRSGPTDGLPASAASATALLVSTLWPGLGEAVLTARAAERPPPLAARVEQELRVEEEFVLGQARVCWSATAGQTLPVLQAPGVLTGFDLRVGAARLIQTGELERPAQGLLAGTHGWIEATLQYQVPVERQGESRGFHVPVLPGLVNQIQLTVVGRDVDVTSPQAVSVRRLSPEGASNTVVALVLRPTPETWIRWQPRQRDTRREAAVFYADWVQVYVPGAGVVEGVHLAQVRPAQGELGELVLDVPAGAAITDVTAPGLAAWRFDPDARQLRVRFSPAQSRAFNLQLRSQSPAAALPADLTVRLVRLRGAAGEVGVVGVATGQEVQLDTVDARELAAANLEDFPAAVLEPLASQTPGLAVRRAFRYASADATLRLRAAPVEPEVRVESRQTLSLGEDRVLLALTWTVDITRAGVFRLSFALPANWEVESLSGPTLSHWTEVKGDAADRVVTLHLKGRTLGRQTVALTLVGPGVRAASGWEVPVVRLREAVRERGQLLVAPEQGLRVQAAAREGVVPVDPAELGAHQKGVLAFRLLQHPWRLNLDLEPVEAWVQVASLQHVAVTDAQLLVQANLQYEIENTGIKTFLVRLPAAAENVRFRGEAVGDFAPHEAAANAADRDWEIKLHRRVIGRHLLQLSYTLPVAPAATEAEIRSVQAQGVNLQRGFLTLAAAGRVQARVPEVPPALQPSEWQVIPRALQRDLAAAAASYTYRLIEPAARLTVRLERHQAASLLPARVNRVELRSVVADNGGMLTHTQLELVPGDKRLLHLRLPAGSRFWFAFVNQNSVWPWNDGDEVLIPLGQQAGGRDPHTVEFFHTSPAGRAAAAALDLALVGPRLDLPLENVTWQIFLNDRWQVKRWSGTLFLRQSVRAPGVLPDLQTYLGQEAARRREQSQRAEQLLSLGNRLLEQGDAERARAAFQNALQLSRSDAAFNEDARVQLQNLKMQQALRGLNLSQTRVAAQAPAADVSTALAPRPARQPLERGPADEGAIPLKLAERLIQQQEAASASPTALRVNLPEQGQGLTFTRPLAIEAWAELQVNLRATATTDRVSRPTQAALLLALLAVGWGVLRLAPGRAAARS